jgi:hypothetical protein
MYPEAIVNYKGKSFKVYQDFAGLDLIHLNGEIDFELATELFNKIYDIYETKGFQVAIESLKGSN